MAEWSNWAGNVTTRPVRIADPGNEAAIVECVAQARAEELAIRVVGSGHSFMPIAATDGLAIDASRLAGVARFEKAASRAWIRAGSKLTTLGPLLAARGLAMENLGDIDVQALGGAIATGTHGTGPTLPNLSARVSGLRLIGADGALRVLRAEDDAEALEAARVSLGVLGIVTAVRLDLVPAYRLREHIERIPVDEILESLDERIAATRHFEFFWYPQARRAEAKALDPTDEPATPPRDENGEPVGDRIGPSHEILPSVRPQRFVEMEYALPAASGPACFDAVRERMRSRHPDVAWPVEYRTLRADDAWLSPAHGRDTVTISIHQDVNLPYRDFFADIEPIFLEHDGRPHWGKMHGLTAAELEPRYPRFGAFVAERAKRDPEGRFLNAHLRAVFGV